MSGHAREELSGTERKPTRRLTALGLAQTVWAKATFIPLLIVVLPLIALSIVAFVLPVLASALMLAAGRPAADFGWMGAALGFGSVAFLLINQAITPVLGPLGTLRFGLATTTVGGLLILTGNWPTMITGTVLIGFGYATNTTAGSQILADFTPKAAWGTLFSLCQAGVPAGGALAALIAGATLVPYGWTVPLAICTGIAAVVFVGLLLLPQRYNLSRPLVPFAPAKVVESLNLATPFHSLRNRPGFPTFVVAGCGLAMVHAAVTQFLVLYLCNEIGLPLAQAAFLYAVTLVTAIAGRVAFGALGDWFDAPAKVLTALAPASVFASLMLVSFPGQSPMVLQFAVAAVIGLAAASWTGLYMAEIARRVAPSDVSAASAETSVFVFLAYMLTPPLVGGLAKAFGWPAAFLIIGAGPLISSILLVSQLRQGQTGPTMAALTTRQARDRSGIITPRALAFAFSSAVAVLGIVQNSSAIRPARPPLFLSKPATLLPDAELQTTPARVGRKP